MSYNDLNQFEKRSLLVNAVAFNRACDFMASESGEDAMLIKELIMADARDMVLSLSNDRIDSIIVQIQNGLDNESDRISVNLVRVEIKE